MIKVGELVKLAEWCQNGPALMQVTKVINSDHIEAMFLEGYHAGEISPYVLVSNIFKLEDYDEAMRKHYERCGR